VNTEHDNTLLSILGKITDSLLLCLLYLLSCLPIITIGAATTALYYTTHKVLRCDRSYLWKEYKRAWKENFKQATICWLIFAGIGALLGFDIYVMYGIFRAGSPCLCIFCGTADGGNFVDGIYLCIHCKISE